MTSYFNIKGFAGSEGSYFLTDLNKNKIQKIIVFTMVVAEYIELLAMATHKLIL